VHEDINHIRNILHQLWTAAPLWYDTLHHDTTVYRCWTDVQGAL